MAESRSDWRVLDGVAMAWSDTSSLVEAAALSGRLMAVSGQVMVDLRPTGVRVRLDTPEHVADVSAAARDLGLSADPTALQQLSVVFESETPRALQSFWQTVLAYAPTDDGGLGDPTRRDPAIRFRKSSEPRPLRHRVHLDVVRPAGAVESVGLGEGSGPYGVRHADMDGNEVDLVPGGALGDRSDTSDWQAVFSAMACYRVTTPT